MATLQKFKHLATHCAAVSASPTRSPIIHLRRRRRRTLRMLLSGARRSDSPSRITPPPPAAAAVSLKLKDFLLSSPPPPERSPEKRVLVPRGSGGRAFTATLRQRLLKKSFRPVLGTIPE